MHRLDKVFMKRRLSHYNLNFDRFLSPPQKNEIPLTSEHQTQDGAGVFPEDSADGLSDSSLRDCKKEGDADEVDHDYEGGRPDRAAALDVLLARSGLKDEGMDVEGVSESDQCINYDHIVDPCAEKTHRLGAPAPESEREQHNGEYRYTVG